MSLTRRELLQAGAGTAAAGVLAGCVGGLFESTDADGYASFFAVWDFAEAVGGEQLSFEDPVGVGRMGHGWTPDGDIVPDIVGTELFVYIDTPEFEWARQAATSLESDHAGEVAIIDAYDGMEPYLLPFDGGETMPEPRSGHTAPVEAIDWEFELWDLRTEQQAGWWHPTEGEQHWHGGLIEVATGDTAPLGVVLRDVDGEVVELGEDSYALEARIAGGEDDILSIESRGDRVEIEGTAAGETGLVFEFYRDGELVYETPQDAASVTVVDSYDGSGLVENFDPHAWVDPVLAQRMVETIADGLAAHDPDNAETYRDNASAYVERIQTVHEAFDETIEAAELDVAVFVGHDSYQYVENRYEFELVTPVGVSPNEDPSFQDISDLDSVIRENGIDTVLYDPFEAATPGEDRPELVRAIQDQTDVDNAEPLTPVSGTTGEWADRNWGWVEQMEQVNLASLERALNPE